MMDHTRKFKVKAKNATCPKKLLNELLDSNVPKTEREHVAANEIKNLREEIERLQAIDRQGKALAQERFALVEENKKLHGESEVTVKCSAEQLGLIQIALDFYSRIGMLQLEEILHHTSIDKILLDVTTLSKKLEVGVKCMQGTIVKIDGDNIHCEGNWSGEKEIRIFKRDQVSVCPNWSEYHAIKDQVKSLLDVVKKMISRELNSGSYGIHSKKIHDSSRTAFDLMQIIRHEFWKNQPNPYQYTVDSHVHLTAPTQGFSVNIKK